ncbi:MAG TPA: glutathione-disulfide reductase [Xanthobacteraceae bacterium]|nr:glutathione-disulfide reductase [Xanthobacteraceae bacterium]
MAEHSVDLFVIGAGSGGVRAARIAANHGARVAIAEEYRVGGTCVIRGCVPKKLLVYASRFADEFEDAAGYGWTVGETSFDWATLIANKDREIARLELAYGTALERAGVRIIKSRAVLEDRHTVLLTATGERVRARHILIATGAAPHMGPPIPGLQHVISSNEAFHLETLPKRILIQGGGYIAVEFASIFNGLGAQVTLLYRGDNILRGFDDDLRTHLRAEMERRGIKIITRATVCGVERTSGTLRAELSDGAEIEADKVMFATGRWPNVTGFGLEAAGVRLAANGGIAVDAYSQTSVPHIYAVGDVTNRIALTPVAVREGHAFADTVFGNRPTRVDHTDVPTAVFSEPEVGTVGLTQAQACASLPKVDIYKTMFRPMKATLAGRETRVFMKLVVDGSTDRVVGCHIAGADAGEMIQLVGIAVKMKATKADFDAVMAVHPTAGEELVTLREKALSFERQAAE